MEHPEFRNFFETYMNDWETIKTIIMFMKLYQSIDKTSKIKLTPYQKVSIVHEIIHDFRLRDKVVNELMNWINGPNSSLDNKNYKYIESNNGPKSQVEHLT